MVLYTYLFLNRPPLLTGNLFRVQYTVYVPERYCRMFPVRCVYNHYLISTTTVHISIKCNLLFQHVMCVNWWISVISFLEFQAYFRSIFIGLSFFPQIKKFFCWVRSKTNSVEKAFKHYIRQMQLEIPKID